MDFLQSLHIEKANNGISTGSKWIISKGETINSLSPVDGKMIASVSAADKENYEEVIKAAGKAFTEWRLVPAPKRGEIVRQIGEALRHYKEPLGKLVSYETGKSLQ